MLICVAMVVVELESTGAIQIMVSNPRPHIFKIPQGTCSEMQEHASSHAIFIDQAS
jgi:hypothetical protein